MNGLRFYIAEVVLVGLDLLCALTAHAGACWCSTRGPFGRLYSWALDIVHPMHSPRPQIVEHPCALPGPYTYTLTASGGVHQTYVWDGTTLKRQGE